jgi:EAL domain-containing protein (putative c-di-GMP-specific phosphodiesterase class I)
MRQRGRGDRRAIGILAAFGCSVVQGFLFSRPIAEKDVPCFIAHAERAAGRLSA